MYSYISLLLAAERAKDLQTDAAASRHRREARLCPAGGPPPAHHGADGARQPGAGQL